MMIVPNNQTTSRIASNMATMQNYCSFPRGTIYVNGTVHVAGNSTSPGTSTIGCGGWEFHAPGGYSATPTSTYGQVGTRIVQMGHGPILRVQGAGFELHGTVELVGDGVSPLIEIEGRSAPAAGRHFFDHIIGRNSGPIIRCLDGYYPPVKNATLTTRTSDTVGVIEFENGHTVVTDQVITISWFGGERIVKVGTVTGNTAPLGVWVDLSEVNYLLRTGSVLPAANTLLEIRYFDENHADMSHVNWMEGFDSSVLFESLSQQALNWTINRMTTESIGGIPLCTCVRALRGGWIRVENLNVGFPACVALEIRDFSPFQSRFVFDEIHLDYLPFDGAYLTLVKHTGGEVGAWSIKMDGILPSQLTIDQTKLIDAPGLDRTLWNFGQLFTYKTPS